MREGRCTSFNLATPLCASITDTPKSPLFDRKIETATDGLKTKYPRYFKLLQDNAIFIADYIPSVKSEANLSDNYRKSLVKALSQLFRAFLD
jgi:hypothetical protein